MYAPLLASRADEVVDGMRQCRQLVAVALLLGGTRVPLVPGARIRDLVDEFDPEVFRVVSVAL
jgi:hypothetical protein